MTSGRSIRLGTRGSPLALWQANAVAAALRERTGLTCEIVTIRTSGDQLQQAPLSEAGGKRLFVKEIEDALAAGDIDLAVHSAKDMPAVLPDGLAIGAVLPRADPRDVVVLRSRVASGFPSARLGAGSRTSDVASGFSRTSGAAHANGELTTLLAPGARIGTSSVRRIAQLTPLMRGATFLPIRGNLDTRLRKLDAGDYDALVLAAAGLDRLGASHRATRHLPMDSCVPAPGQGAIAVEARADDADMCASARAIDDRPSALAVAAERALVSALGGGCQVPIGAIASADRGGVLRLHAIVISLDGSRAARETVAGEAISLEAAEALGRRAADGLLGQGAKEILDEALRAQPRPEGAS